MDMPGETSAPRRGIPSGMHDRLIVDCFTICKREKTRAIDLDPGTGRA